MNKWISTILCVAAFLPGTVTPAADGLPTDPDTARRHADRFLQLLERRPSFGTALERVCSYHIEQGTMDGLLAELRNVPPADPKSSVRRLIAGMLEVQRGHGADAVELLRDVEKQRPDDPVTSLALGLAARAAGDSQTAIGAFERAIQKQPAKADLRTLYQQLARLHQQAGHPEQALQTWQELEAAFPRDPSIREDVATRLQQAGQLQPALQRWKQLARETRSPERRTQYQLAVADLQRQLGDSDQALQTLEAELNAVRPESWLDQLIRNQVESVLLAADGRLAVTDYYRQRLSTHPDDVTSCSRLAELLAADGKMDEAAELYQQAIERRPSSTSLRVAHIRLLAARNNIAVAVEAGRQLIELEDAGTDEFELVGRLLLRDESLEPADREQQASEVWMRICGDQQDAGRLGYTARLHRQNGLPTRAIELYNTVIPLEPNNPAWREELGQTLYELGDRQGALREWNLIADGPRESTRTLALLSEILEQADESTAALAAMQKACTLEPDIRDRIRLARLLQRAGKADAGYEQLDLAAAACVSAVDHQVVTEARRDAWKQDPALYLRISQLRRHLTQNDDDADSWLQLAVMLQTEQQFAEALRCVERSTELTPNSVPAWQAAAEISFQAGLLSRAADASRQVAKISPQQRIPALQQVIRLEQQLGRLPQALEAAEILLQESPGHAESCRQFADLCFQSGRDADGLDALRQCLRRNPGDVRLSLETAGILVAQFQTDDARSLLWQTFDQATSQQDRLTLIEFLLSTADDEHDTDRILDRLTAATSLDPVDRILCIASATRIARGPRDARDFLESASRQTGQDVRILRLLVELAEATDDLELAARYQQQVTALTTDAEERVRLATLQFQTGQLSETELSWIRDARSGSDTVAAIRSIDRFLDAGRIEAAELMSQRLAADRPHDWRVLYRLAMIQWRLDRRNAAVSTLQDLIALELPDDHTFPGEDSHHTQSTGSSQDPSTAVPDVRCPLARRLSQIAASLNWLQLYTGNELWSQKLTAPADFGAARCAAIGFLWLAAEPDERHSQLTQMEVDTDDPAHIADWCAFALTARWSRTAEGLSIQPLASTLRKSSSTAHQLVLAGLLSDGGVFRRPADSGNAEPTPDAGVWLADAAEQVALERPEWLTDIGGWRAVHRRLLQLRQSTASDGIVDRLLQQASPLTLNSATDLAFARQDLNAVTECLQRQLQLHSQQESFRSNLPRRQAELAGMATLLASENKAEAVFRVIDLMLQLQATRYTAIRVTEQNTLPVFRLTNTPTRRQASPGTSPASNPENTASTSQSPQVAQFSDSPSKSIQYVLQTHLGPSLTRLLKRLPERGRQLDLMHELQEHLRTVAQTADGPVHVTAAIALAACETTIQQPDSAMLFLVEAAQSLPDDVNLRMTLAQYLRTTGAHQEALQLISQLQPQHRRETILQTELLALKLSASLQDQNRARLAASRLFELQLKSEEVSFIAEQLQLTDLPEVAQRFESRLNSSGGGGAEQLQQVMQQYFDAGNLSAAVRIARQFVLHPSITLDGTSVVVSVQLRRTAIEILAASDSIKPMVRQLQNQMRDDSATFHERHLLVELLRADGRSEEAEQVAVPLRDSLVGDPQAGIRLARQLERQGRLESACDVCRYLLEADITLFHRDYYRFIRLFEKNGRLKELAQLVLAADLSQESGGHWGVQQLTERVLPTNESLGLQLFQAAWMSWPSSHQALLANVSHDSIWTLPEVLEHGRQQLLPTSGKTVEAWDGIAEQFQVHGRGRVTGRLSRLLPVAEMPDASARFLSQIQSALQDQPNWHAGRLYAALLENTGDSAGTTESRVEEFLNQFLSQMPPNVAWVTACYLHQSDPVRFTPSIIRMLEYLHQRREAGYVLLKSGSSWDSSPDFLLLQLYGRTGDQAAAARVMARLEEGLTDSDRNSESAEEERRELTAELADSIREQLPDLAGRIKELGSAEPTQSASASASDVTIRSAAAEKVIQAVRDQLLTVHP